MMGSSEFRSNQRLCFQVRASVVSTTGRSPQAFVDYKSQICRNPTESKFAHSMTPTAKSKSSTAINALQWFCI